MWIDGQLVDTREPSEVDIDNDIFEDTDDIDYDETEPKDLIRLTPKQVEYFKKLRGHMFFLVAGGSRSGKTFATIYMIFYRALMVPGSKHIVCRNELQEIKENLLLDTIPQVSRTMGLRNGVDYKVNKVDMHILFTNGSIIHFNALSDEKTASKVLGLQAATIFVNEAQKIPSFKMISILRSRLVVGEKQKTKCTPIMIFDCNPPTKGHWLYKFFVLHIDPIDRTPFTKDMIKRTGMMYMQPRDNVEYLGEDFLATMHYGMSKSDQVKFVKGQFGEEGVGLWHESYFHHKVFRPEDHGCDRIVVAVDPAAAEKQTSDEDGIIVAGRLHARDAESGERVYAILDDYTVHKTSATAMFDSVFEAADTWSTQGVPVEIVIEINTGNKFLTSALESYVQTYRVGKDMIPVVYVTASVSKKERAESIIVLYETGRVFHNAHEHTDSLTGKPMLIPFLNDLEGQMLEFNPENKSVSPDRLDAAVYTLRALHQAAPSIFDT